LLLPKQIDAAAPVGAAPALYVAPGVRRFSCPAFSFIPPPRSRNLSASPVPTPLSNFLPANFDRTRPVALIAGQGIYPQLIANAVRRAGVPLRLIAFEEETGPELIATFAPDEQRKILVGRSEKCSAPSKISVPPTPSWPVRFPRGSFSAAFTPT
jgi:hypothetical protein